MLALAVSCQSEEQSKGDTLYAKKDYKGAIEAYNEYLKLHPSHVKSLYNRGRSFEELNQYDEALKDFEKVLDIDGKNTSAMLSLAKYYYRSENFDQSLYFAELAIKEKDDLAEGYFWVGRAAHHMGEFPKARSGYNNAINLNRQYGEAFLYRGALSMQEKKKSSACQDFNQAVKLGVKEAESAVSKYCK